MSSDLATLWLSFGLLFACADYNSASGQPISVLCTDFSGEKL